MKPNLAAVLIVGIGSLVTGCVFAPSIGDREASVPPRIVVSKDNVASWDNPGAFGPVPAARVEAGRTVCASLNTKDARFVAKGFHSGALDASGKPFPTGGYYCVTE